MRCLSCGYDLRGIQTKVCPECGRKFDPNDARTYDTRPRFEALLYWMPGFVVATTIGFICFAGLMNLGASGWVIWIFVPVCIGCALGIYCKATKALFVLSVLGVSASVIFGLQTVGLSGMFCGLILFVIMMIPIGAGLIVGIVIRWMLQEQNPMFKSYLPALLLLSSPFVLHGLGFGRNNAQHNELAVTTSRVVIGTPEDVWDTLMFFEDVETPPPLLMRIALPKPLSTSGEMDSVGDRRVCVYNKGKLTKEIVEVVPNQTLGFKVVEQEFEPSVVLTGGSFELVDLGDDTTRLTLSTRYQPVHSPRIAWRWAEILGARTLHTHVINGVESQILQHEFMIADQER